MKESIKKIQLTCSIILSLVFFSCNQGEKDKATEKIEEKIEVKTELNNLKLRRYPLPYPPVSKQTINLDTALMQRDSLFSQLRKLTNESLITEEKAQLKDSVKKKIDINTDILSLYQLESICKKIDDSKPVELYDGTLGVTNEFVKKFETYVGQIQWKYDFGTAFTGAGNEAGNVRGVRWCTGTLIGKDIFLTAGHCFDREGSGWDLPARNGKVLPSRELAILMKVNFNYQVSKNTNQIRNDTIDYPVIKLEEYREDGLDYAIIILGKDKDGKFPGERFGFAEIAANKASLGETIAIIQHPLGNPKVIEAGQIFTLSNDSIDYDDIDTQSGSSGSSVISAASQKIIGVHVMGGCDNKDDGSNHAVPIFTILPKSAIIKKIAK